MAPQTAYSLAPNAGQAGLLYGNERSNCEIVTGICGAIIPPGAICEFVSVSGQYVAFPLKDTGTTTTFTPAYCGIALMDSVGAEQTYVPFAVPNVGAGSTFAGYPIGATVGFVRRGTIWTLWDGNTGTGLPFPMGAMNVLHSSTGAHAQGVVTTLAASATAGNEIDALGGAFQLYDPRQVSGTYTDQFGTTVNIVVMKVNLPGSAA
jgi:hypothetical protein